ncbi:MAG TPA: hypothetical protein VNO20_01945 [Solirubrobacterales bacterium]|nr:hypothetical protein [Solirubrobacterales bacterium]
MGAAKKTLAVIGVAALGVTAAVAPAAGEGPTREEYVAQVDPICEQNTLANKRILKGVQQKVSNKRLPEAGTQFIRASEEFGKTLKEIRAVPRPSADNARLVKWFGFLGKVKGRLHSIGKALKEKDQIKAVHERIGLERSSNAANNVGFVFGFDYCRLTPSRFT